ncbi:Pre-mRNA-processing protein 40C [Hondaea fermentalgiana]|uniref:Pre-mRNA-processing protein 40C n=1 Tax=Hondaea fermentalgiana TaxID=2315210 RepID=A0A2R5G9T6_9STRA|nr:Pre-mRNA-processing protein 40C [Hondaea fermentalgiana]|eukprot:GBG25293.1 Pre-mRNA-processing protein 40C [Hondaea fermentalgiana]
MTGQSTYDKPVSLMSHVERKLPRTAWKAYAQDGKIYYHNAQSNDTTWEEPMEFTMYKERLRALCNGDVPTKDMDSLAVFKAAQRALEECNAGLGGDDAQTEEERRKELTVNKVVAASERSDFVLLPSDLVVPAETTRFPGAVAGSLPADAKDTDALRKAFQDLLNERNVPPTTSWQEALTFGIANDVRFHALRGSAARREALADYAQWKAEENTRLRKERLQSQRDVLQRLLSDLAAAKTIDGNSSARSVLDRLRSEHGAEMDVWERADWALRDDDIKDFLDELYDREKREREQRRDAELEALDRSLQALADRGQLPLDGTAAWNDIKPAVFAFLAEQAAQEPGNKENHKDDDDGDRAMADSSAAEVAPGNAGSLKIQSFIEIPEKELADHLVDFILSVRKARKKELADAIDVLRDASPLRPHLEDFRAWFRRSMLHKLDSANGEESTQAAGTGLPESFKALRKTDTRFVEEATGQKFFRSIKGESKDLPPGPDGVAESQEALDDLVFMVVGQDAKEVLEELHEQLNDAYKIMKKDLKANRVRVAPSLAWDGDSSRLVANLPELVEKLGEDARRQVEESFSEPVQRAAFGRLRADADKKVRRRMEDFKAMLADTVRRSKHLGMSYEDALRRIKREPEFDELDSDKLRRDVYAEHMADLEASSRSSKRKAESAAPGDGADEDGRRTKSSRRSYSRSPSRSRDRRDRDRDRDDRRDHRR